MGNNNSYSKIENEQTWFHLLLNNEKSKESFNKIQIEFKRKVCELEEHLNNNPKQNNRIIANLILMSNIYFNKNDFIDK
jgi:hypothetical protein